MINEPTHRGRLKDVICITGRKHSAAAGHNAAKATIWKIELYEGSVFQTVFQFLAFPRVRFAYPRLCRFCPSENFVRTRRATYLQQNLLNSKRLPLNFYRNEKLL